MSSLEPRRLSSRTAIFHDAEFHAVATSRPVADVLRDNLEDAESQLRLERRRARRAQRRVVDLERAVDNWRDLLIDFKEAEQRHRYN